MKNNFAPISKIPSDIFSLIPEYLDDDDEDENLVTMTHVCRGWRELLITRPSLWARLHCEDTDRTRVYIERSKSAPLKLSLYRRGAANYIEDAFLLAVPHLSRLKSLIALGPPDILQNLTPHISRPLPLLTKLTIKLTYGPPPVLNSALFNGDLSSLRLLSLTGVVTHLPWRNMSKLTTFVLCNVPEDKFSITQLLDFFEDAHHLRDITLRYSIPTSSDAPPGRVVSLSCLKNLTIRADSILSDPVHPNLLNHLSIPARAKLTLVFGFMGGLSPIPPLLPETLENLGNTPHISSVNLYFDEINKYVRLHGSSGEVYMLGNCIESCPPSQITDRRIVRSLGYCFDLRGAQRLAVAQYESETLSEVDESGPYHILSHMKNLRTLTLTRCNNPPFILALDPTQNRSKRVLCPKLEEVILYVQELDSFNIKELRRMAKERALVGMKLPSITIVGLGKLIPREKVAKLREYVAHVLYKFGEKSPRWDAIPGDEDN